MDSRSGQVFLGREKGFRSSRLFYWQQATRALRGIMSSTVEGST